MVGGEGVVIVGEGVLECGVRNRDGCELGENLVLKDGGVLAKGVELCEVVCSLSVAILNRAVAVACEVTSLLEAFSAIEEASEVISETELLDRDHYFGCKARGRIETGLRGTDRTVEAKPIQKLVHDIVSLIYSYVVPQRRRRTLLKQERRATHAVVLEGVEMRFMRSHAQR